jgi:hypothetical protein
MLRNLRCSCKESLEVNPGPWAYMTLAWFNVPACRICERRGSFSIGSLILLNSNWFLLSHQSAYHMFPCPHLLLPLNSSLLLLFTLPRFSVFQIFTFLHFSFIFIFTVFPLFSHYILFLILVLCGFGAWTQVLHLELLHQPSMWWVFFLREDLVKCSPWLNSTAVLLISASWITKIIEVSHWCLALFTF